MHFVKVGCGFWKGMLSISIVNMAVNSEQFRRDLKTYLFHRSV